MNTGAAGASVNAVLMPIHILRASRPSSVPCSAIRCHIQHRFFQTDSRSVRGYRPTVRPFNECYTLPFVKVNALSEIPRFSY